MGLRERGAFPRRPHELRDRNRDARRAAFRRRRRILRAAFRAAVFAVIVAGWPHPATAQDIDDLFQTPDATAGDSEAVDDTVTSDDPSDTADDVPGTADAPDTADDPPDPDPQTTPAAVDIGALTTSPTTGERQRLRRPPASAWVYNEWPWSDAADGRTPRRFAIFWMRRRDTRCRRPYPWMPAAAVPTILHKALDGTQ